MRLVIIKMLVVLLIFSIGCDRGSDRENIQGQEEILKKLPSERLSSAEHQQLDSTETFFDKNAETNNGSNGNSSADPKLKKELSAEGEEASILNDGVWSLADKGLFASLILNLLLLILFIFLFKRNTNLNKEVDDKNTKLNYKNREIKKLERELQQKNHRNINQFPQKKPEKVINDVKRFQDNRSKSTYVEEKPYEVVLDHKITAPSLPIVEAKPKVILYAGKPSDANTFSAVSSLQDEHRSIFKLILENKDAGSAKFEVIDNEYIFKMAANSPDTYLYHVCKPENSNQNFDGQIITTEKGTARLLEGKWKVNDEDKATIKFQ